MKFWLPFKDRASRGEAGNMLLITGLMASALAVAGGKVMLDRSIAQRKANQMAQSMKQAKEIPGSAAMIAKALISLPPNVAKNISVEWTTPKLVSTPTNMPLIYPIPYVGGAIGSPALPAVSVNKTVDPPAGANWDTFGVVGTTSGQGVFASAQVNVYTNDSTRATSSAVNTAIAGRAVAGGSATIKRTKSVVTYSFRNCTVAGVTSNSFTGRYCATATIDSPNYASDKKGSDSASAVSNKGVAQLGLVTPPPAPLCGAVSTPGNAKVRAGDAFSLDVNATGVAVGYRVRLRSPAASTLASSGTVPIKLPFDHPRLERLHTISGIPTSGVTSALNQPGVSDMTLDIDLIAIDGSVTTCNAVVQLDKPIVACETGSFLVSRTGADLRTCNISLRKDNGLGFVKQVQVVQTNTRTGASSTATLSANFSDNDFSTTLPCSQDAWTFKASLKREYPTGTAIADSQCSPQQSIAELPPECDGTSVQNTNPGRKPPPPATNLEICNVKVVRTPASHTDAKVWIDGADKDSSGTWASNVWTGQVPCAASATTMTAELKKGSTTSACWTKPIGAVDPAKCMANSTRVYRAATDPSQCYVTLTRSAASSSFVDVKINGVMSSGTWSALDWKSNLSPCLADGADYQANLTDFTGAVSDCGTDKLIKKSYCLDMKVFRRGNPSRCEMTIDKDPALLTSKIKSVSKNGAVQTGSWTGNKWKSSIFNCNLGALNFNASITQKDNSVELCPSFSVPVAAPVCQSISATRQVANPSKCNVIMRKGALSGPISTAIINGTPIAYTDQPVYQTTVDCPLTGETLITGSISNASGADSCNDFKMWTNLVGTHMGTGLVKCAWQTQVSVNGGAWFSVGGNRYIGNLTVAISTDQGFKPPPFCNVINARAVDISCGGGGSPITLPGGGCGSKGGGYLGNGSYQFSNQDNICDGNTDINTKIHIDPASLKYKVPAIAGKGTCP